MTTNSQTSSSEDRPSSSFDLLAKPVQRWIWRKGWSALRDIQERSIPLLMDGGEDVVIAAATAGGKTEAAFLPLFSRIHRTKAGGPGFDLLYVSPLRALINDQMRRLEDLCEAVDLPAYPWHGDVSAATKAKARKNPRGILLITPESLEAMFVLRGLEIPRLFGKLDCIVIDELHALLDSERGVHVRSLLCRLESAAKRRIRRVGLSATLGDMALTRQYVRPEAPGTVAVLESRSDGAALRVLVRGYRAGRRAERGQTDDPEPGEAAGMVSVDTAIAANLFGKLRGATNLIFAGSRQRVETFADRLRQSSERQRLPNEFFPHHANLSREHRSFVEARLKAGSPATAVCTSTLELGIDIGDIACVAHVGAPSSVASLRQRLGRSGRRGQPAVLRMYETERGGIDDDTHPVDALRLRLVRSIAMVDLLLERWCERPRPDALHLSTLVHQVLSVIAERGGVRAPPLFALLCGRGPFRSVDKAVFGQLLRRMGDPAVALIEQSPDGTLLLGPEGERIVEHYSFYAVFETPDEYRVTFDGRQLGTIPITVPLAPEMTIVFSGRRWRVVAVHDREKVVLVKPSAGGRPPSFAAGDYGVIDDRIVRRMRAVLERNGAPRYLDAEAVELLAEGRAAYHRLGLARRRIVELGERHHLIATWDGTVRTMTLALALRSHGFHVGTSDGFLDVEDRMDGRLPDVLRMLASSPPPDGADLAADAAGLDTEKYHRYLSRDLLVLDAVSSKLTPGAVPEMARQILEES